MDSVGKDVFPDEMELFLRMEKRLKRLQDKAFTSIAQSIREKSLEFSEKKVLTKKSTVVKWSSCRESTA